MSRRPNSIDVYHRHAAAFAERYEAILFERAHKELLDWLPESPGLVLNVGAGSGRDAAWFAVMACVDVGMACRTMVGLLSLADEAACERALGCALNEALEAGELPDLARRTERFGTLSEQSPPKVDGLLPSASSYDVLLAQEAWA